MFEFCYSFCWSSLPPSVTRPCEYQQLCCRAFQPNPSAGQLIVVTRYNVDVEPKRTSVISFAFVDFFHSMKKCSACAHRMTYTFNQNISEPGNSRKQETALFWTKSRSQSTMARLRVFSLVNWLNGLKNHKKTFRAPKLAKNHCRGWGNRHSWRVRQEEEEGWSNCQQRLWIPPGKVDLHMGCCSHWSDTLQGTFGVMCGLWLKLFWPTFLRPIFQFYKYLWLLKSKSTPGWFMSHSWIMWKMINTDCWRPKGSAKLSVLVCAACRDLNIHVLVVGQTQS